MFAPGTTSTSKTTSHKFVLPFYIYAALSFLVATVFLFTSSPKFLDHYFHPHILAITHIMALGWGTMIILGASHQLVPVLTEGKLYSNKLAYTSFVLAVIGIPLLVYGFFVFNMGWPAKWGGRFIVLSILSYLINLGVSISRSKKENVHAAFVFTSIVWLFFTAFFGLALVYNFTYPLLPNDSLHYLPLHVHAGLIGWFLLLIIGVASRLIPMFLISKYSNVRLLWWIYVLVNAALLFYISLFYFSNATELTFIPGIALMMAVLLFIYYCYSSYLQRIRRQVDDQIKLSLLSIVMILLPIVLLLILISLLITAGGKEKTLVLAYGFAILFGWITAIILGMTFKTLPFIVWNKEYHFRTGSAKSPSPKDLFSNSLFKAMGISYLLGFLSFVSGILLHQALLLKAGSFSLIIAALLYTWNVFKVVNHKPHMV